MLDSILMLLHLWLYQHWLLHAHMYDVYNGFYHDFKSKDRDKYATDREEMHHAETSIWSTFLYCSARLNMRLTETLTPPTA